MATRSGFGFLHDRSEVRSSQSGDLSQADSPLLVMSGLNEVRPTSQSNLHEKDSRPTSSTAAFLIGSVLSTSGQPRRGQ